MADQRRLLGGLGDEAAWSLLDAAPDAIFLVSDSGEIAFASEQASVQFGCPTSELVGLSVDELLPEELRSRHRAHRTRYRAQPEVRLMGAGLELRARRRDGSEFFAEISLSPFRSGDEQFVMAAVRDISERVAAEDHLHRVLATLDATEDGLFIFDAETLRYSHVNEGAVRLVGYSKDELTDMGPVHLNPYTTEAQYREMVAELLDARSLTVRRETRLLRKDGSEVPVEKTYRAAATARDGSRWIVAVARDISDRLAAEADLRESQAALQAAEQAVVLAADRDRIAQDLHDTVIQRLFGAGLGLQALASTVDDRVRDRIETTVQEIDDTIRDLRTAIFSLQVRQQAPAGLRGRILDLATDAAVALGFEPRVQFDGPIDALSDEIAEQLIPTLREALSNVANHAGASRVRVSITVADDTLVEVVDDGVGIQGEVHGGHGLANMARRAEKLGGTAHIEGGAGGGTRLEWRVPLEPT